MSNDKASLPERLLVAGLTALVIARCLIADDPGRLRLTSGGGPLTLNIMSFVLLLGWAVWRGTTRQPLRKGAGWIVPAGLLVVAGLCSASTMQPGRYQHPGWFISWNWLALAALCFVAWQMCSAEVARGLAMVLLATATSIAIQSLSLSLMPGLKVDYSLPIEPPLVGETELREPIGWYAEQLKRAPFGNLLNLLLLPTAVTLSIADWRRGGARRLTWMLPALLLLSLFCNHWSPLMTVIYGFYDPQFGHVIRWTGGMRHENWNELLRVRNVTALWVVCGLVVLIALLSWRGAKSPVDSSPATGKSDPLRWSFYLGGVAGLLLGVVLATGDIPAEAPATELLRLGGMAAVRAVIWFFVFSVLESLTVGARVLHRSLALGTIAVFVGSFYAIVPPSMAIVQTMFLALLIGCQSATAGLRQQPGRVAAWLPVPIALALLVANLLHVSLPGLSTASNVRSARAASVEFPTLQYKVTGSVGPGRIKAVRDALGYLDVFIIAPLREANADDPGNSALMLELARWKRIRWTYLRELHEHDAAKREGLEMLALAEKAAKVDPGNRGAAPAVYESLLMFVQQTTVATDAQLNSLEKYIGLIAEREPRSEVELRFRVVQALIPGRNAPVIDEWSVKLLRLDATPGAPHGKLTLEQRSRLLESLSRLPKPSAELQPYLPAPPKDEKKEK